MSSPSTGRSRPPSARIASLDALRVVAMLNVVVSHSAIWPRFGGHGVTMFIVLSGFLITRLLMREVDAAGTIDVGAFWRRRLVRLVPAYYVFLGVTIVIDLLRHAAMPTSEELSAFTFTLNYFVARHGNHGGIAHTWSLSLEQQFYLVWPIAFLLLRRRGMGAVRAALWGGAALSALWRTWLVLTHQASAAYVWNAFETRVDVMAIGCLLAVHWDSPRVQELARRAAARWWYALVTLGLVILSRSATRVEEYRLGIGMTITALLAAALVAQVAAIDRTPAGAVLGARRVQLASRLTYSAYLYHILAIGVMGHVAVAAGWRVLGAIALSFAVGAVSYHFVELPSARLLEGAPRTAVRVVARGRAVLRRSGSWRIVPAPARAAAGEADIARVERVDAA